MNKYLDLNDLETYTFVKSVKQFKDILQKLMSDVLEIRLEKRLPMPTTRQINKKGFEELLFWLDENREIAGQKYESIRSRLIKFFQGRGCFIAEELADETIDRVIQQIENLTQKYQGEPALFFYGVGKNVFHEFLRRPQTVELSPFLTEPDGNSSEETQRSNCFSNCLKTLTEEQQKLIVSYYEEEKIARINQRKQLTKELNISPVNLRIRVFKIRNSLKKCIANCVNKKKE